MVTQITRGIKISVATTFEGTYYKNQTIHFAFAYHITIENHSKDQVQLISRHWDIYDALNFKESVDGEGVVVSFLGFVIIPIFKKYFDALLDGVFFHGFANKLYVSCKKLS